MTKTQEKIQEQVHLFQLNTGKKPRQITVSTYIYKNLVKECFGEEKSNLRHAMTTFYGIPLYHQHFYKGVIVS